MPFIRELSGYWQLRFYDASREPKRTRNSIRKSTRPQAEKKAAWHQQLYEYGDVVRGGILPLNKKSPASGAKAGLRSV